MLQEENALPDAELDAPVGHRDRQLGLSQGTLDVRRHVVGPLVVVAIEGDILRYEPPQKCLEIAQHIRRRVFLDQQRSRGVRDVDGKEAERDRLALDPAGDLGRNLLDLARCSVDRQSGLGDGHGWLLLRRDIGVRRASRDALPRWRGGAYPYRIEWGSPMRSTFFAAMLLALPAFSGGARAQNTDLLLVLAA